MNLIHHIMPYMILLSTIVSGIYSGYVMFEEIELLEHINISIRDSSGNKNWKWIVLFVSVWVFIYGCYYVSTLFSYHKLNNVASSGLFEEFKEAAQDKRRLLLVYAIIIIIGLISVVLFFKTHHKYIKILSVVSSLVVLYLLFHKTRSLAKYHTNILWWLSAVYATEVLFGGMVASLMVYDIYKNGSHNIAYETHNLYSKTYKI